MSMQSESLVRKAVLPWQAMFVVLLATVIVLVIEAGIAGVIYKNVFEVAETACTAKSVTVGKEGGFLNIGASEPNMLVECDGQEHTVGNGRFLVAYLLKPQPFVCSFYKSGEADCHF